ncbi:hypothetical protein RQP46_003118 [Phenoliferia psychrophenolica]
MSAVHQIVLHPFITQSLKLYRAIQYSARFLAWYCLRKGYTNETVARLAALKSTLGLSRKLMRIGKPLEHSQAAVKAFDIADPFLKFTTLGRQIGYAGYLVNDMLIWAHTAKVRPFTAPTIAAINQRAARMWLSGIIFSIISSIYKLTALRSREAAARRVGSSEKETERKASLRAIKTQQAAVRYQLVQDSLDALLPAGTLGLHHLDDGVLGIAGTITSLMGLRSQIQKVLGTAAK